MKCRIFPVLIVLAFSSLVLRGQMVNGTLANDQERPSSPRPEIQRRADTAGISLAMLLDQVLKNNPSLQAARSRAQSAQARVPQAKAWEDPQVGVEFYATPVTSANPF